MEGSTGAGELDTLGPERMGAYQKRGEGPIWPSFVHLLMRAKNIPAYALIAQSKMNATIKRLFQDFLIYIVTGAMCVHGAPMDLEMSLSACRTSTAVAHGAEKRGKDLQ